MAVYLNLKHPCDWVIVDEAQDLNSIRRVILGNLLKDNGRLIAVGDPFQAVYGFTGADSNSMNKLRITYNMEVFPLSIS